MKTIIETIILNLAPGIAVSIITALVTVKLSVKQFRSQRWWEKKAEAYSQIIEQLSYLQYYFGEYFNHSIGTGKLSVPEQHELTVKYKHARESIVRAAASGAFIVSSETTLALEKLLKELDKEDPRGNWIGDIDRCYGETKECIAIVRGFAKKDLLTK